jgi:serine O-acetyltransferase
MQSTVSKHYSADIHPAALFGIGIHLRTGAGAVVGQTAVVGDDCNILEGCTLGGTGKETGDRHPKVANGVTIQDGASILGNIPIGEGAIITSKSIVTKPVPALAIVSGVPARVERYRELTQNEFDNDLQRHLAGKYLSRWTEILDAMGNTPGI